MHATPEALTVVLHDEGGTDVRSIDFDEMAVNINRFAPGTDLGPLLGQLSGGDCSVAHWGYLLDGALTVQCSDGQQQTVTAGQLVHTQPNHGRLTSNDGGGPGRVRPRRRRPPAVRPHRLDHAGRRLTDP